VVVLVGAAPVLGVLLDVTGHRFGRPHSIPTQPPSIEVGEGVTGRYQRG
jgi:hypothetical protein